MQNMNYYYDFSGQKYNHPLSLSMNSFDRRVFSRQTSLEISFVLKGSYEVVTEHVSHVLREQELVVIAPSFVGPYYAKEAPRPVTVEELDTIIKQFGEAAL